MCSQCEACHADFYSPTLDLRIHWPRPASLLRNGTPIAGSEKYFLTDTSILRNEYWQRQLSWRFYDVQTQLTRCALHTKLIVRTWPDHVDGVHRGWMYAGSANFSQAAWGSEKGDGRFVMGNTEAGVGASPPTCVEAFLFFCGMVSSSIQIYACLCFLRLIPLSSHMCECAVVPYDETLDAACLPFFTDAAQVAATRYSRTDRPYTLRR